MAGTEEAGHHGTWLMIGRRALVGAGLALLSLAAFADARSQAQAGDTGAENVMPLSVRAPQRGFNRLLVTLDLCAPATNACVTVDDVMVDTGSTGLRFEPGTLPAGLGLPPVLGPGQQPLWECLRFVHDRAWGRVARADIRLGRLVAHAVPVQIIAPDADPHPADCPASGVVPTSNATLGIGAALTDCPEPCDGRDAQPLYFTCSSGDACDPIRGRIGVSDRVANPVGRLPGHNNGVVIDLPSVPPLGARAVSGALILGIGTADNNRIGDVPLLRLDGLSRFTTVLNGTSYPQSSIDSGTETYVVPGENLPRCDGLPWALCGVPERRVSADLIGSDGRRLATSFSVGDYAALTREGIGASDRVAVAAVPAWRGMVWGAPFFLGKRVFLGFEAPDSRGTAAGGAFYGFTDSMPRPRP